jgi:hypothetical protein
MQNLLDVQRRALLAAGIVAAAPRAAQAALALPASGRLAFEIRRNGQPIGRERLDFRNEGDLLTVAFEVDMQVKLGPVPLFTYRHEGTERWRDGRFESLETRTTTNGAAERLSAKRTEAGIAVNATKHQFTAPGAAAPLTHWNRLALSGPLFNPQTGALFRVNVRRGEEAATTLAKGLKVPAERYAFSGEFDLVDWYDVDGVWAALRAKAKDGSTIDYRRI